MGKLSDLNIQTTEVEVYDGQSVTLRGLSAVDVDILMEKHGKDINSIVSEMFKTGEEATMMAFLRHIVKRCPRVMAAAVALANENYPEGESVVHKLPIVIQAEVMAEVLELTMVSMESLKKTMARYTTMMMALAGTAENEQLPTTPTTSG